MRESGGVAKCFDGQVAVSSRDGRSGGQDCQGAVDDGVAGRRLRS